MDRRSDLSRQGTESFYRQLRRTLRQVRLLRNLWHLLLALREALLEDPGRVRRDLTFEFETHPDPWGHSILPNERERLRRELAMLDAVRGKARFGKVLEVGCAEGEFTELLADLCDSLLAVDLSSLALARACQKCHGNERVRFTEWDLLRDPLPGTFDLIVVVHVLDYYRNPFLLHKIRKKLIHGIRPGGFLLLGNVFLEESPAHNSWWSRYLVRGAKNINAFMTHVPDLKIVASSCSRLNDCTSYDILCQKER